MASNTHLTRNALLNKINDILGSGGFLRFYDGTQPATPDNAKAGNTLLASLALSSPPFLAAAGGAIKAAAIADDPNAAADGEASWASFETAGGARVIDVSVGLVGTDITLDSISIRRGARVSITDPPGYTLTMEP